MAVGGSTIASLIVRVSADISGLQSGLGQANASIQNVGRGMAVAGAAMTAGITAPLTMFGKEAANAAREFDKEMRNIQSISKQSDASLVQLGNTLKVMSADISKTTASAADLAQGFYQIQSSGFAGNDAMTVLAASTKAASAGLTDTETAVRAIVASLNAYGKGAGEATAVSDILFKTVDIGILTFGELASQIGDILPTAAAGKIQLSELGAAMATLTKGGISASESATALNQVMLAFIDPSDGAKKAAKALGIELSASALASKGLSGAMAEVGTATGGDVEKMAQLFGNVRALKGALALTRDEGRAFASDLQALGGAAGATSRAFEIQTQSFDAQMKSFANTMQVLKIELGTALLPIVTSIMQGLLPLIRAFSNLPEPVKKIIVVVGMLAAALGPVLMFFGALAMALPVLTPILGGIATIIGVVIAAINPLTLVLAAVVAAVFLLGKAWTENWGGIQTKTMEAVATIQSTLSSGLAQAKDAAITAFNAIKSGIIGVLDGLIGSVGEKGAALVQRFADGIRSRISAAIDAIRSMADQLRALLPGSDAQRGPLSDLFASGKALPGTLAKGIMAGSGALDSALAGTLGSAAMGAPAPAPVAGSRSALAGNAGSSAVNVTINNPVGRPAEADVFRQLKYLSALGYLAPLAPQGAQ